MGRRRQKAPKHVKYQDPFTKKNWFRVTYCPGCGRGPIPIERKMQLFDKEKREYIMVPTGVVDEIGNPIMTFAHETITVKLNPLKKVGNRIICRHGCGLNEELNS